MGEKNWQVQLSAPGKQPGPWPLPSWRGRDQLQWPAVPIPQEDPREKNEAASWGPSLHRRGIWLFLANAAALGRLPAGVRPPQVATELRRPPFSQLLPKGTFSWVPPDTGNLVSHGKPFNATVFPGLAGHQE